MTEIDAEDVCSLEGQIWALEQAIRTIRKMMPLSLPKDLVEKYEAKLEQHLRDTLPSSSSIFQSSARRTLRTIFDVPVTGEDC